MYTRREGAIGDICTLDKRKSITPPYQDVEWFVQEKFKIGGESPGSGNTANIGSIRATSLEPFARGQGPFATLGEDVFCEYWANFGRDRNRDYATVSEFLEWRKTRATRR